MEVMSRKTGRDLDMFWITVPSFVVPETSEVLKRFTKASDESYKVEESEDDYYSTIRVITTSKNHEKVVRILIKKRYVFKYENYM